MRRPATPPNRRIPTAIGLLLAIGGAAIELPAPPAGVEADRFRLGPLEANGDIFPARPANSRSAGRDDMTAHGIEIHAVDEGGIAARAGLRSGDRILGAGGERFGTRPLHELIETIESATTVALIISRGGEEMEITVEGLPEGTHDDPLPERCTRCRAVAAEGLEFLKREGWFVGARQRKPTSDAVVASVACLAFLASGSTDREGPYREQVDAAIADVLRAVEGMKPGAHRQRDGGNSRGMIQINWGVGLAGMALAQAHASTGRDDVLAGLREVEQMIAAMQEESGGFAHGSVGNRPGYLEVGAISNWMMASLGMMRRAELESRIDDAVAERGLDYIERCLNPNGGMGYSVARDRNWAQPSRTAGAVLAFLQHGRTDGEVFDQMTDYLDRELPYLAEGHASVLLGMFSGSVAAHLRGEEAWTRYWETWTYETLSARNPDGSFSPFPRAARERGRQNHDRLLGTGWSTSIHTLALLLGHGHVPLLAGDWERSKGDAEPVDAGDGRRGDGRDRGRRGWGGGGRRRDRNR